MKRSPVQTFESILRSPERLNYNAIILEVFQDTINAKMPPGSRKVKRSVLLSEHIKAKHHLLKPGIPCQIELRQGKPYVIAIFEEGVEAMVPIPFVEDDGTLPSSPLSPVLTMTPRPTATIDCENETWLIEWDAIPQAQSYEVYWTADEESDPDDAGDPVTTVTDTQAEIAFDTADPPKQFFAVRAVGQNNIKGPFSPWVTDEAVLAIPGGFTVCPLAGGYTIDVDADLDTTQHSPAFDHWELEWADDDAGLNGEKWGDVLPEDLPLFITNQMPGSWTFDSDQDESWGHLHGAQPDEWDSDGATAAGSRILIDGTAHDFDPEVAEENRWYTGQIEQAIQEAVGVATDVITAKVKINGTGTVRFKMVPGVYTTSVVTDPTGTHEEYQASNYQGGTPVELSGTGWLDLTLTLPESAVGQPIGFLAIKADCQGGDITSVLIDDIHWGPGGITPAKQKWFRLRAMTCAGLPGEYTEWKSGWPDLIIFERPHNHGTVHNEDHRYQFQVGAGYIERSDDGGETFTDITADLPVPPFDGDPIAASDLEYIQVVHDPSNPETFYFLARWQETPGVSDWYGWILKTTDMGLEDWTWTRIIGGTTFHEECAGWEFTEEGIADGFDFDDLDEVEWPTDQNSGATWEVTGGAFTIYPTEATLFDGWLGISGPGLFTITETSYFRAQHGGPPMGYTYVLVFSDSTFATIAYDFGNRGSHNTNADLSAYVGKTVVKIKVGFHVGNQDNHTIYLYYACFDNVLAPGPAGTLPLWMDLDNSMLALNAAYNDKIVIQQIDAEMMVEQTTERVELGAYTLAEIEDGLWTAFPRWLPSGELLVYGRLQAEDESIIQALAVTDAAQLLPIITETDWLPEDYCGGLIVKGTLAYLVRHGSTLLTITDLDSMTKTITYGSETGAPVSGLKPGHHIFNPVRGSGGVIDTIDTGLAEIVLVDDIPLDWAVDDVISAQGVAELWTVEVGNLTTVFDPTLVLDGLPVTIEPDGMAMNFKGTLILGNRVEDDVMLIQLEPDYAVFSDVTADYAVADGIVALKWVEGGCIASQEAEAGGVIPVYDNNGNQVGTIPAPSTGGVVLTTPPSTDDGGNGQTGPPQWRQLHHHELAGLADDDHPQYHNNARGDARYSQLGHIHDDRYYTEAEVDTLLTGVGGADIPAEIHAATSKTTPVDADELALVDSEDSWALKKLTWANLKATLQTWLSGLYNVTRITKLYYPDGAVNVAETTFTLGTYWLQFYYGIKANGQTILADMVQAVQLQSSVATGTPPLVVASTTAVDNLNADLLDGQHASEFALSDLDGAIVSKLRELDDGGDALVADSDGNVTAKQDLILDGEAKAIKGDGSNFPTLGTTTLAEKFGHIYLGTGRDVYPFNDGYPLFQRVANAGFTPIEHWSQAADDDGSWTGFAGYTGFSNPPNTVSRSASRIGISHTSGATRYFYYRGGFTSLANKQVFALCAPRVNAQAGIMIDDGVNNADGLGANNFFRVFLDWTGGVTTYAVLTIERRTGGGAVTTTTFQNLIPSVFYGLGISATGTLYTNWSANAFFFKELPVSVIAGVGSQTWTPARMGLYGRQTSGGSALQAIWDWWTEA